VARCAAPYDLHVSLLAEFGAQESPFVPGAEAFEEGGCLRMNEFLLDQVLAYLAPYLGRDVRDR